MAPTRLLPDSIRGRLGSAKIAVVTIVEEELDAAREVLEITENIRGSPYYVNAQIADNVHEVILRKCPGPSNVPAEQTVSSIIEDFRPSYILMCGIAGGLGRDNVQLGDVVVADYVDYTEFSKLTKNQLLPRRLPYDHPSLYLFDSVAAPLRHDRSWFEMITMERPEAGTPRLFVGNIVAGEKILGDPENGYQIEILRLYDKALAVDMESYGLARAVYQSRRSVHYNPQYLIVRGISDQVFDPENNETRKRWRPYAARAAAVVVKKVIATLLEEEQ